MSNWLRNVLLMAAMVLAAFVTHVILPSHNVAGTELQLDLQAIVPTNFESWSEIESAAKAVVNPTQKEVLERIYSSIVTRTYRDSMTGSVVMLSIAYGRKQSEDSQVHRPEVCYPAQGFTIDGSTRDVLNTSSGRIPVTRLVAHLGMRQEPITYWIRIGNRIVSGILEQKIAIVKQGLSGNIPDGLIFRVSSVGTDVTTEYRLHDKFVSDLVLTMSPSDLRQLLGEDCSS